MLLLNLGSAAAAQQHFKQANIYLKEGLLVGRQIGHREGISVLLLNLGEVAAAQNNFTEAESYFEEALQIARQLNRPHLTAKVLHEYGKLYLQQKEIEKAEFNFKEAISVTPEGNQELIALANYGLAQVAKCRDELAEAIRLGEKSLAILEHIENSSAQEVKNWLKAINK
jgi:tetratricopeptide (TPR) repeat protein